MPVTTCDIAEACELASGASMILFASVFVASAPVAVDVFGAANESTPTELLREMRAVDEDEGVIELGAWSEASKRRRCFCCGNGTAMLSLIGK